MVHVHLTGWMPIVLALAASAPGQHHHGGASFASQVTPVHMHHGGGGPILVGHGHPGVGGAGTAIAIVGGYGGFGYYGLGTPYYYPTPLVINGPVIFPPVFPAFAGGLGGQGGGLMLPMPPADRLAMAPARPRRPNPERARELVEIGDRSFRGGNIHRAEERFSLAAKADPDSPLPQLHLAQVSLVRKEYATAAARIRSAVASGMGAAWLANAPDIQAMFAEPGDFARHMAKLESHLQANPGDRDAWFVLGVEWYLSGRTQQAADAFQRLTDRRPDEALAAFLDATKLPQPPAN